MKKTSTLIQFNFFGIAKRFVFSIVAMLFMAIGVGAQITTTIGAGANVGVVSSNAGPIYRSTATSTFDFSKHVYLYTAAELSAAGINPGFQITSIAWNKSNAFGTAAGNNVSIWRIRMKNSTTLPSSTWSSADFATQTASYTLVYSNTSQVIPAAVGYIPLTLTTPFTYTGGSLEIASDWDCSLFTTSGPTTGGFAWRSDALTNQVFGGSASSATITMALQTIRPQIQITAIPSGTCSGQPAPGSTTGSASICANTNFTLGLQNSTSGSGVTYQWSRADDLAFTLNVTTLGNGPTQTTFQTSNKYYRCLVTCTNSGLSAFSDPLFVTTTGFLDCYCPSSATTIDDEDISNVTFGSLNNSSDCVTLAPGSGSIESRYSNYKSGAGAPAAPQVTQGIAIPFSFTQTTCGGDFGNKFYCWIDYNQNGSFTDPGELAYDQGATIVGNHTVSGFINIPLTATPGLTGMRVLNVEGSVTGPCSSFQWGEVEDYLIDVLPSFPCSGIPTPGNTAGPASICANTNFTLGLSISPTTTGISFQWQSADNVAFTVNFSSLGTASTQTTSQTTAKYYRCVVTCANSGLVGISIPLFVNLNPTYNCTCPSGAAFIGDEIIHGVSMTSTSGSATQASLCGTLAPGPGSIIDRYSNYKTYSLLNMVQGANVNFQLDLNSCDDSFYNGAAIWIDFNQDGDFLDAEEQVFAEEVLEITAPIVGRIVTGTFGVPSGATIGLCAMRVTNAENYVGPTLTPCLSYSYGETEDYLVNIIAAPCTGQPVPGTTGASASNVCSGSTVTLTLPSLAPGSGYTYQWQSADDVAFTTNVQTLGTTDSVTTTVTGNRYYRCNVTCGPSGLSAFSTAVLVNSNTDPCVCASYCLPTTAFSCNEHFTNVTFAGINNNSGCGTPYQNFTSFGGGAVTAGSAYILNYTGSAWNTNDVATAYVDWNHDLDFSDPGETYPIGTANIGSGSIAVPCDALAGPTRMRVRVEKNPVTTSPCGLSNYGEAEDYCINVTPVGCSVNLNLKAYAQCPYIGGGFMNSALSNQGESNPLTDYDTVSVHLCDMITYNPVYSWTGIWKTDGTIAASFPAAAGGTPYFIAVTHRNTLRTWAYNVASSTGQFTLGATNTFDFSVAQANAAGSNQFEVEPGVWAFYGGDFNQDLAIDAVDYLILDPDLIIGASGNVVTDLTGDGTVDAVDYICFDPNLIGGVTEITP